MVELVVGELGDAVPAPPRVAPALLPFIIEDGAAAAVVVFELVLIEYG